MELTGKCKERAGRCSAWIKNNCERPIFAVLLNVLLLGVLLLIFQPAYETNDDMGIFSIVGGVRGQYDPHAIHLNYVLGLLLSALYRITWKIPWYPLVQYAALFLSFTAVTHVAMKRFQTTAQRWMFALLLCYFSFEGYMRLQFTKTAGIVSAAGVFVVLYALSLEKVRKRLLVLGIFLACVGSMYRLAQFLAEVFLLTGIAVYQLFDILEGPKDRIKKKIFTYIAAFGVLFALVFGLYGVNRLAYTSPEWERYLEHDEARTILYDYGFPNFDANQEAYEALGIDKVAYKMYRGWNHTDPEKFSVEIMNELVKLRTEKPIDIMFFGRFAKNVVLRLLKRPYCLCAVLFLLCWLFFGKHKRKDVVSLISEVVAGVILYLYLYYKGRYLRSRVDVGLWFAASLVVLWLFQMGHRKFQAWKGIVLVALGAVIVWPTMKNRIVDRAAVERGHLAQRKALEMIAADDEHLYISKCGTVSLAKSYGVFEPIPAGLIDNLFTLGGWTAEMPICHDILDNYGVTNPFRDMVGNEGIILIDDEIDNTLDYLHEFYDENAQAELLHKMKTKSFYKITTTAE